MNRTNNKYSRSVEYGIAIEKKERRQPLIEIIRLLNLYHSVDNLGYLSIEDKGKAKNLIFQEVKRLSFRIGKGLASDIRSCLHSKDRWDVLKDNLMK